MKKKTRLLPLGFALLLGLSSCVSGTPTETSSESEASSETIVSEESSASTSSSVETTIPDVPPADPAFSYYPNTKFDAGKTIKFIDTGLSSNDRLYTAQAIQGLFARDVVTYYVDSTYVTNGTNVDRYYLETTSEKYGFEYESTSLDQAIQDYVSNWEAMVEKGTWGSQIDLSSYNSIVGVTAYTETTGEGYSTPGYIVYRPGAFSVNTAATLAGITGFLPVSRDDVDYYKGFGLVEKFNLDNVALSYSGYSTSS